MDTKLVSFEEVAAGSVAKKLMRGRGNEWWDSSLCLPPLSRNAFIRLNIDLFYCVSYDGVGWAMCWLASCTLQTAGHVLQYWK
jgi:hypothetical protein